jgi:hypothetical protein
MGRKTSTKANSPQTNVSLPRESKSASVCSLWQERGGRVDQALQKCILTYIGGAIVRRWKRKNICQQCQLLLCSPGLTSQFLKYKQFQHCRIGLQHPSELVVNALTQLETIFMANYTTFFNHPSVVSIFLNVSSFIAFPQPACHPQLRQFLFHSYFIIRIRHQCKLFTLSVRDNKHKAQTKAKHIGLIAKNLKRRSLHTLNRH